ncbi:MAG TPA: hypothetical protein V6D03_09845, partial [Candidatus Caenarcaniphilales bacterium]
MARPHSNRQLRRQSGSPGSAATQAVRQLARLIYLASLGAVGIGVLWFNYEQLTLRGVPVPIIISFLNDETARSAYFQGNSKQLHDRLEQMGVEAQVKAFYRPQFSDEAKLDQYIHQLLYDQTGYVGDAYRVNSQGILIPKYSAAPGFNQWFQLAREVGLVSGSLERNGIQYVINSEGDTVPYEELAALFPQAQLQSLAEMK